MTNRTKVQPEIDHLKIVIAHHDDQEFYTLARVMPTSGGAVLDWNGAIVTDVTHEVPPAALFAALPHEPCESVNGQATHAHMCVILDACDDAGEVIDDREVSIETANKLLDEKFKERLEAARSNLAHYYKEAGQ